MPHLRTNLWLYPLQLHVREYGRLYVVIGCMSLYQLPTACCVLFKIILLAMIVIWMRLNCGWLLALTWEVCLCVICLCMCVLHLCVYMSVCLCLFMCVCECICVYVWSVILFCHYCRQKYISQTECTDHHLSPGSNSNMYVGGIFQGCIKSQILTSRGSFIKYSKSSKEQIMKHQQCSKFSSITTNNITVSTEDQFS